MARTFTEPELVIATHNPGKLREIADLLAPFGTKVLSAGDLGLPEPVEDEDTFIGNALIKARAAVAGAGKPALSDDSGLVVPALGGRPGIHSARWAGPEKDFDLAMEKVWTELGDGDDPDHRRAYFACALALCWPDGPRGGDEEVFEGTVHGTLIWPPRGDRGFGYDPMFIPDGHTITFGEFDPAEKHTVSHRADAFRKLVQACFQK